MSWIIAAYLLGRLAISLSSEGSAFPPLVASTVGSYNIGDASVRPAALLLEGPAFIIDKQVEGFYDGNLKGIVPWRLWAIPCIIWLWLIGALALAVGSLVKEMLPRWHDQERLTYPMLEPIRIFSSNRPWRNTALIVGSVIGLLFPLSSLAPWTLTFPSPFSRLNSALDFSPLTLAWTFLMPSQVSLSIPLWVALFRVQSLVGEQAGLSIESWPRLEHQALGAYLGIAALSLRHCPSSLRTPLFWVSLSLAAWALKIIGFSLPLALLVAACFIVLTLGYVRVRCEAGIPSPWAYPYDLGDRLPLFLLGSKMLGPKNLAATATAHFLTRGTSIPSLALFGESFGLLRAAALKWVWATVLMGFTGGLVIWLRRSYYDGANMLGWCGGIGNMWEGIAANQLREASLLISKPSPSDTGALAAICIGALSAAAGHGSRHLWFHSPFQAAAFPLAATWGGMLAGPGLFCGSAKKLLLYLGGQPAHKIAMRFVSGFIAGHVLRKVL